MTQIPYQNNVKLLIRGNGNPALTDYNFSDDTGKVLVSRAGNVCNSITQSKFNGSSLYFDGNSDYLVYKQNSDFYIGTDDFTVSAFIYLSGNALVSDGNGKKQSYVLKAENDSFHLLEILGNSTTTGTGILVWDGSHSSVASASISQGTWHHILQSRINGVLYHFLDGVLIGSGAYAYSLGSASTTIFVGGSNVSGWYRYFYGYMAEITLWVGVGLYSTNFTVPTEPYEYVFPNPDYYYQCMIRGNGENNSQDIRDDWSKLITVDGNAKISTAQSKFNGSSIYFDGNGDRLSFSLQSAPGTGYLSIDFWVYMINGGKNGQQYTRIVEIGNNSSNGGLWLITNYNQNPTTLLLQGYYGGYADLITYQGSAIPNNEWHHIAIVRIGDGWWLYIDGVLRSIRSTNSLMYNYNIIQTKVYVGANNILSESFYGYIAEFRMVVGSTLYSAPFTVPSSSNTLPARTQNLLNTSSVNCTSGESLGDYRSNSIVFTNEPLPFIDMEDGGTYFIEDYVTYNGVPASRRVDLYILQSRRLVRSVWSDPITGYYCFDRIKPQVYFVWCEDYLRVFDPVTHLVQVG